MKKYNITLESCSLDSLFIISCLIKHCNHFLEQADQCVTIMNNVGKCNIYSGHYENVSEVFENLRKLNLNVKIEECV